VLRLGIAGIGIAAEQVLPNVGSIADTVRLTAVADFRPEALRAFGNRYPDVRLFDSVEALCASDAVDVVWISTPNEYKRGAAELMELADALSEGREPFLDAAWGRATLEVCVAILESGAQRRELELRYQVPAQSVGTW